MEKQLNILNQNIKNSDTYKNLSKSYESLIPKLKEDNGYVKHDYFTTKNCVSKDTKNSKNGFEIHHVKETESSNLSIPFYAQRAKWEYQIKENLVYVNKIQHIILHLKILIENGIGRGFEITLINFQALVKNCLTKENGIYGIEKENFKQCKKELPYFTLCFLYLYMRFYKLKTDDENLKNLKAYLSVINGHVLKIYHQMRKKKEYEYLPKDYKNFINKLDFDNLSQKVFRDYLKGWSPKKPMNLIEEKEEKISFKKPEKIFHDINGNHIKYNQKERLIPKDYQKAAIYKLYNQDRGLITFEMGLGKTLTAVLLIEKWQCKDLLIVCPDKVKSNWENYFFYHTSTQDENYRRYSYNKNHILIITPEEILSKFNYQYDIDQNNELFKYENIIIDEIQKFSATYSAKANALYKLSINADKVLLLSGNSMLYGMNRFLTIYRILTNCETPVFSLAKYLKKDYGFGSIVLPSELNLYKNQHWPCTNENCKGGRLSLINSLTGPFKYCNKCSLIYSYDIEKEEFVLTNRKFRKNISSKVNIKNEIEKIKLMEELKDKIAGNSGEKILDVDERKRIVRINTGPLYYQFCKSKMEKDGKLVKTPLNMPYKRIVWPENIENKIKKLDQLIKHNKESILVFYNFSEELSILESFFNNKGYLIYKINGEENNLDEFKNNNSKNQKIVLLCQTDAAGVGVEGLQDKIHICYFFSIPKNYSLFEQAKARIYRIGQKRDVSIFSLFTKFEKNLYNKKRNLTEYQDETSEENDLY